MKLQYLYLNLKQSLSGLFSSLLIVLLAVSLAACGSSGGNSSGGENAPDLQAYYASYMAGLEEENRPKMTDVNEDTAYVDNFYPGLRDYELKQSVLQMASISAVAYEFALVECANESDVEAVKGIMQARIDSQISSGAFYPETIVAWQKADLIVSGNVVALIVAGDDQTNAVEAFKKQL